jgi:redox-sensitive bicupin YhaK (pirin superfamily)
MPKTKTIQQILPPPPTHMVGDGFRVHNFFPSGYNMHNQRMSPFYMLDYNSLIEFPASDHQRGVDVHPHRGFETVTIAYKGAVAHHDSAGNSGVITEGGVQWMTAASGILHKEYHEKEFSKKGGPFQMVQLWVNLLAKDKMTPPKYQGFDNNQLGKYKLPEQNGMIEVIAGDYKGTKGPASTFSPIELYNARLEKAVIVDLSFPADFNTGIVVIEGSIRINDDDLAPVDHFCLFRNDGTEIKIEALENTVFLVLSGQPLKEPIVAHGPFLMNTVQEIRDAMTDFGSGKFGHLE